MGIQAPEQHDLYDGHFIISGNCIHQANMLNDVSPWDHIGNDESNLLPVEATVAPREKVTVPFFLAPSSFESACARQSKHAGNHQHMDVAHRGTAA